MNTLTPCAKSFYDWLSTFPDTSLYRLKKINLAATSARHIILTLSYSIIDPNIQSLSRVITNFLLIRMKHERAGKQLLCNRLEDKLHELHSAIDAITGVKQSAENPSEACKSTLRRAKSKAV